MPQLNPLPTPSRFTIPQGAILPGQSLSIPLHVLPIPGGGGYKVGITVQAKNQLGQSTAPTLFEFDTGGQGFWLSPQGGTLPTPALNDCPLNIQYTSGIQYWAQPQQLTLTFTEAQPPLSANATVGVIGKMLDAKTSNTFPIFGNFYGDFGATLQAFVQPQQTPTPANSLLTVLAQLPAPYNTGFIVDVGAYPGTGGRTPSAPQLIVGLTRALRDWFPNTIPMAPGTPYTSPGGQTFPTFKENLISANLHLNSATTNGISVVFDTGAPAAVVHEGSPTTSPVIPAQGDQLQLTPNTSSPTYAILEFTVGQTPGVNQASHSTQDVLGITEGYINTGITPFFQSPIMFDLANGVIGFPFTGIA